MLMGSALLQRPPLPTQHRMMHTEKNIAKALFGTLFGIDGKSKDNTKARVDLEALCDRPLQNMKEPKGKQNWTKPKAWFNLGKASYEGNYLVGENAVDVPRWVCSESKEGSQS